ncbi:MAG: flavin reductase family protein [Pseudomonadota bacterium]
MKIVPANLDRIQAHDLFMSVIVPRPIAFVSTVGVDGVYNVAPFSALASMGLKPPRVCFYTGLKQDGSKKDTLRNIEFSKGFVVNVVDESIVEAMNQASAEYPSDVDEFKEVGLTPVKSELVKAPRVAESPVNMECKLVQILTFGDDPIDGYLIIGEVVLVHIKDSLWAGNHVDTAKLKAIGRLGGRLYCHTTRTFELEQAIIRNTQ